MFATRKRIFAQAVAASIVPSVAPATALVIEQNKKMMDTTKATKATDRSIYIPHVMVDGTDNELVKHSWAEEPTADEVLKKNRSNANRPRRGNRFLVSSCSRPVSFPLYAFVTQVMEDSGVVFKKFDTPQKLHVGSHHLVNDHTIPIPRQCGSDSLDLIYVVENDENWRPRPASSDTREGWQWGHTTVTVVYLDTTKELTTVRVWTNKNSHYSYADVDDYREAHGYSLVELAKEAGLVEDYPAMRMED